VRRSKELSRKSGDFPVRVQYDGSRDRRGIPEAVRGTLETMIPTHTDLPGPRKDVTPLLRRRAEGRVSGTACGERGRERNSLRTEKAEKLGIILEVCTRSDDSIWPRVKNGRRRWAWTPRGLNLILGTGRALCLGTFRRTYPIKGLRFGKSVPQGQSPLWGSKCRSPSMHQMNKAPTP